MLLPTLLAINKVFVPLLWRYCVPLLWRYCVPLLWRYCAPLLWQKAQTNTRPQLVITKSKLNTVAFLQDIITVWFSLVQIHAAIKN